MDERLVILNDLTWAEEKVDESITSADCGLDRDSMLQFLDRFFPPELTSLECVALGVAIGINAEKARERRVSTLTQASS